MKKILYISSIALTNQSGGSVIMYNHLKENHDFDVYEYNNEDFICEKKWKLYDNFKLIFRKTRFEKIFFHIDLFFIKWFISKKTINKFRNYNPDVILTVAHGNLFYIAQFVSVIIEKPLISVYHDWWPVLFDQEDWLLKDTRKLHTKRFFELFRKSNLNLCVSDGMKNELGNHSNSQILYPYSGLIKNSNINKTSNNSLKIIYGGNISHSYGRMLRELLKNRPKQLDLDFIIYGNPEDWSKEDIKDFEENGWLKKPVFRDEFFIILETADVLFSVSSFEQELEILMKTNFPSKIALYSNFNKPIIQWGPDYSSGSLLLSKSEHGKVINSFDFEKVWEEIIKLKNQETYNFYVEQSHKLNQLLSPNKIHETFKNLILEVIENS